MNKRDDIHFSYQRKSLAHDHSEGWAVSYADFLMVLISFFVIYFNMNDKESSAPSSLSKIVLSLASDSAVKYYEREGEGLKEISSQDALSRPSPSIIGQIILGKGTNVKNEEGRNLASVLTKKEEIEVSAGFSKSSFSDAKLVGSKEDAKNEVIIDLPSNVYEINGFELTANIKSYLDRVLGESKKYKDSLNIVVIGHTDDIKFKGSSSGKILNNNMVLSSLRASRAVEYILSQGFSENQVFIKATNYQLRNSRTLSIQLVER
jgi:flagellar motor protein MotB